MNFFGARFLMKSFFPVKCYSVRSAFLKVFLYFAVFEFNLSAISNKKEIYLIFFSPNSEVLWRQVELFSVFLSPHNFNFLFFRKAFSKIDTCLLLSHCLLCVKVNFGADFFRELSLVTS